MANSKRRCTYCKDYFPNTGGDIVFFCSSDCRVSYSRRPKFGSHRKEVSKGARTIVEERDQRCRICGTSDSLHAHHVIYRSQGGSNDPENLLMLCHECHSLVHSDKTYYQPRCLWLIDDGHRRIGDYDEDR